MKIVKYYLFNIIQKPHTKIPFIKQTATFLEAGNFSYIDMVRLKK